MAKLKGFTNAFLLSYGLVTLLHLILNIRRPENFTINFYAAYAVMLAVIVMCETLIFKTGVSIKSLWLRRMIVIAIACIAAPVSMISFGVTQFKHPVRYIIISAVSITVCTIAAYIVIDKIEKENISKINKQLEKNK